MVHWITLEDGTKLATSNRILWRPIDDDTRYSAGDGVAWAIVGEEVEEHEEWDTWTDDDGEEHSECSMGIRATGRIVAIMVGDDRPHLFDRDDLTPIADDDYCSVCGQIGCRHNF